MNAIPNTRERPSATARAEAAAWIARLHGPNRTPDVEAGFRRWLSEDPNRSAAVELLTDTWERSARLRRRPIERVVSWEFPGFRISVSRAAFAAVAIAVVTAIGTISYLHTDGVTTGVGEQRTLALEDGTRIYLNTDTQIVTHYSKQLRRVELEKGEAMFDVAKRPDWPFIVTVGDHQVKALGTAFVVRRDAQNIAVTLVEGKVTVSQLDHLDGPAGAARVQRATSNGKQSEPFTLAPGQRLTFARTSAPKVDQPAIDAVTAWQQGQVALDNTPLADAVAEMNRYSNIRLVVEAPKAASVRVSGVFRAGDQEDFARAVARTYQLEVRNGSQEIVLAGNPGESTETGRTQP